MDYEVDDILCDEEGFVRKMCRHCVSALQRLGALESSTRKNIADAIESIQNSRRWSRIQSRKWRSDSSAPGEPRLKKSIVVPHLPQASDSMSSQKHSPDVAVSIIIINEALISFMN